MEETTNKSGVSAGMVTIIVIIVAIIFGGGAYAYVNNKATKEKKDLNAQITQLQSQVAASETTATTTTPSSTTSATIATDVTASWKTYTDDKNGFSFKYPSTWVTKEAASEKRVYASNQSGTYDKSNVPASYEQAWISYDTTECSVTNESDAKNGGSERSTATTSSVTIDGSLKTLYSYTGSDGPVSKIFWSNGQQRMCASTGFGASNTDSVTTLKNILSTFQFTK